MEPKEKVTPEEAALSLSKDLQREPWFSTVGVGEEPGGAPALFVYVKTESLDRDEVAARDAAGCVELRFVDATRVHRHVTAWLPHDAWPFAPADTLVVGPLAGSRMAGVRLESSTSGAAPAPGGRYNRAGS